MANWPAGSGSQSLACQDWTNTKAAYRFLSNSRVNESAILAGHFQATKERFQATDGPVLLLHDTTEFSYTRESVHAIGILHRSFVGREKAGKPRLHTIEAKESIRWLENVQRSTALLGEPVRCIHIGDRESDIYELFCTAQANGTKFLVRTCVDRSLQ